MSLSGILTTKFCNAKVVIRFPSGRAVSHTSDDYIQVGPDEYEIDVLEEIFPNPLRIGGLFRLEIELAA